MSLIQKHFFIQLGELQNVTISISAKHTVCVHIDIKAGLIHSTFPATF